MQQVETDSQWWLPGDAGSVLQDSGFREPSLLVFLRCVEALVPRLPLRIRSVTAGLRILRLPTLLRLVPTPLFVSVPV